MPLKHSTETILVAVLGVAIALAGLVLSVLSAVASPGFLWIGAFLVTLAYPLLLYPHFRERRADYEFRLLHFLPALFLLLWLILTILTGFFPIFGVLRAAMTFGWALPLVLLGFLGVAWFSFHVIRQWPQRIGLLLLIFAPFALLGILGDRFEWNVQLASLLERTGTGATVSSRPIAANTSSRTSSAASRSSRPMIGQKPPVLPHAGPGLELFAVMVPAATSAAVHLRAMRRARA